MNQALEKSSISSKKNSSIIIIIQLIALYTKFYKLSIILIQIYQMNNQQWQKNSSQIQQDPQISYVCLKSSKSPKFMNNLEQKQKQNSLLKNLAKSQTIFNVQTTNQILNNLEKTLKFTQNISKSIYTIQKKLSNHNLLKIIKIRVDQQIPILNIFYQLFLNGVQKEKKIKAKFLQIVQNNFDRLLIQKFNSSLILNYQGKALFQISDGRIIQGNWQNNKFQGFVKIIYPSKIIYYGQINDYFIKNGKGNLYLLQGVKFVGTYLNGKIQGRGKLYDKQKKVIFQGQWRNGETAKYQKA